MFPFWLWHYYVQTIRCSKLSLAILFVCSRRRTGRRVSRCQDFNEQKRKAMQTATLGLFISSFTPFFVWHIDALTQFIVINMSSINVCSNTLTPWRSNCVSLQRKVSQTCTPQKKDESNSVFTVMVTDMLTHTRTRTYTIVKIKSTNRSTLFHEMRIGRTDLHRLALT